MLDAKSEAIIRRVSILKESELELFLGDIEGQDLESNLLNVAKGYALYRLNRLAEASDYVCKAGLGTKEFGYILEAEVKYVTGIAEEMCQADYGLNDFGHILRTGYYKGCDGNWHDYDDGGGSSYSGGGGGGGDDCGCDSCIGAVCILGGIGTFCCSGKCIFDSCCGCESFCGEDFCLDGCTVIGRGVCGGCC